MKKIVQLIQDTLEEAFAASGYDRKYGFVSVSNRPDLCQYQCNGAMAAAKSYQKAPKMIADEVVEKIKTNTIFQEITAVMPGFINITLASSFLAEYFNQMAEDENLGITITSNPKTIIIDYGGANIAKPLHVGHLRPAVVGESIKRIKRCLGHKVIGDVHLGDFGMPMGLVIEQLRELHPELVYFDASYQGPYPKEPPFAIDELEMLYTEASKRSKEDESFKKRAQEATFHLQHKRPAEYALWKHIFQVSVKDLKKNYENLNTEFDLWKGESDAEPYMADIADQLKKDQYAFISQGALVVDVALDTDTKEIPPCMIKKTDGAFTYAASDIATIYEREKNYQPDEYIYITDKRQDMYFTQIFRTVKKTGIVKENVNLLFLGLGTMCGKDGKPFKTRDGGVARLDSLITSVEEKVYEKIKENKNRTIEIKEEEARIVAKTVGLAALKYGDLSNQITKEYVFDLERFTSFEGDTGPYILYTIVRIQSILSKYKELDSGNQILRTIQTSCDFSVSERELLFSIVKYNEMIENAERDNAPHRICIYIYELSNAFNKFYQENKIITEENQDKQKNWIAVISLVSEILLKCIDLLGFSAPDRM